MPSHHAGHSTRGAVTNASPLLTPRMFCTLQLLPRSTLSTVDVAYVATSDPSFGKLAKQLGNMEAACYPHPGAAPAAAMSSTAAALAQWWLCSWPTATHRQQQQ
jgi:hypothetical protein